MILQVCALYDSATGAFGQPFFVAAIGAATRMIADGVNSKREDQLAMHPEDFVLFQLGSYDDSVGRFVCPEHPVKIADAVSFKRI